MRPSLVGPMLEKEDINPGSRGGDPKQKLPPVYGVPARFGHVGGYCEGLLRHAGLAHGLLGVTPRELAEGAEAGYPGVEVAVGHGGSAEG